ncbi:LANO_0F00958g1_1 [Lachancea nothofagi CBS 11611]|uniref:LANO_0F00958g1_1 n=1 Tax=Lachancea nothofagi CBS 11611 TaxID=1266666 RepID=A0A1G4K5S0_9SACH|nr:LANO_0F00958g1_1 [Lachancea nothofagi CBS 11611]
MSKIVFKHQQADIGSLSVAGNFSQWAIQPMVFNAAEKQWEFQIVPQMLANLKTQENSSGVVTYFKFIDDKGVWFTDDNFAKEIDEHGNENNALYLKMDEQKLSSGDKNELEAVEFGDPQKVSEDDQQGPASPDPTPVIPGSMSPLATYSEESPVMINDSDLEENYHETQDQSHDQDHNKVDGSRHGSADTEVSVTRDPNEYKNFLHSIIYFFRSLFYRWFGVGKRQ